MWSLNRLSSARLRRLIGSLTLGCRAGDANCNGGATRQLGGASLRGRIGEGVGPLSKRRLDEAFGLTIGLWRIGSCRDVFERSSRQARAKAFDL